MDATLGVVGSFRMGSPKVIRGGSTRSQPKMGVDEIVFFVLECCISVVLVTFHHKKNSNSNFFGPKIWSQLEVSLKSAWSQLEVSWVSLKSADLESFHFWKILKLKFEFQLKTSKNQRIFFSKFFWSQLEVSLKSARSAEGGPPSEKQLKMQKQQSY